MSSEANEQSGVGSSTARLVIELPGAACRLIETSDRRSVHIEPARARNARREHRVGTQAVFSTDPLGAYGPRARSVGGSRTTPEGQLR